MFKKLLPSSLTHADSLLPNFSKYPFFPNLNTLRIQSQALWFPSLTHAIKYPSPIHYRFHLISLIPMSPNSYLQKIENLVKLCTDPSKAKFEASLLQQKSKTISSKNQRLSMSFCSRFSIVVLCFSCSVGFHFVFFLYPKRNTEIHEWVPKLISLLALLTRVKLELTTKHL